ncbi:MAG: MarR family winged helix-turn-helix transcriptional regulator [Candidatus Limnocylindrales bacterium]
MPQAKEPDSADRRADLIDRIMAEFDAWMHRMASTHATEFADVGLTMSQAKVLYLVQVVGTLRMSELATRLGVTLSTTSGLVERLVEAGLVVRRDDPADRRQVILSLTDAAVGLLDRMRELNAGHMRRMLAHVSEADLAVIERSIHVLAEATERMQAEPSTDQQPSERDPK